MTFAVERERTRGGWPLALALLPLLATAYQLAAAMLARDCLSASTWQAWFGAAVRSPWLVLLLAVEAVSFVIWTAVLARISLARAFPISAVSYAFVVAMGALLLHQRPNATALGGSVAILCGAGLLAFDQAETSNRRG